MKVQLITAVVEAPECRDQATLGVGRQWSIRFRSEHASGAEGSELWRDDLPAGLGQVGVALGVLAGGDGDVVAVNEAPFPGDRGSYSAAVTPVSASRRSNAAS